MKQATIAVKVLEVHESSLRIRVKTGYGDPVLLVHKKEISLDDGSAGRMRAKRNRDRRAERASMRKLAEAGNDLRAFVSCYEPKSFQTKKWDEALAAFEKAAKRTK